MNKQGQVIISYILSKTMFFGLGASYIIGNAKQNSWLAIILGYLFGLIVLHFLIKKRLDLINKNILGKMAYFVLIFFILINAILSFTVHTINFYLPETPTLLISFSFLSVIIYGSDKGFEGFKRLCEIIIFIGVTLSILGWIGNFNNIDLNNFYPLLYGFDFNLVVAILATMIFSVSPLLLFLMIRSEYDKKCIYLGYILGCANSFMVILSTIGTLGITLSSIYRYPEYIAYKKISAFNIIERVENVLSSVWLMDMTILGILSLLCLRKCCSKNITYIISFICTFLTVYYFIDIYQNTVFIYKYTIYFLLGSIIITLLATKKEPKLLDSNS